MGRQLSAMLDRLHQDWAPDKSFQLSDGLPTPRTFLPGDPVFVQKYSHGLLNLQLQENSPRYGCQDAGEPEEQSLSCYPQMT